MSQAQLNYLKLNRDYFNRALPQNKRITPKIKTIGDREQRVYQRFYYGLDLEGFHVTEEESQLINEFVELFGPENPDYIALRNLCTRRLLSQEANRSEEMNGLGELTYEWTSARSVGSRNQIQEARFNIETYLIEHRDFFIRNMQYIHRPTYCVLKNHFRYCVDPEFEPEHLDMSDDTNWNNWEESEEEDNHWSD